MGRFQGDDSEFFFSKVESECYEFNSSIMGSFNDAKFYDSLWQENGCRSVEIASVAIRHNDQYCYGIQSLYRLKFEDGTMAERPGPEHINYERRDATQVKWLHLKEEEFIMGLRVSQYSYAICGISFITNQREVQVGTHRYNWIDVIPQERGMWRIVAFAGVVYESCYRIGFTAEPLAWKKVGPYFCLRELLVQGRATEKTSMEEEDDMDLFSKYQKIHAKWRASQNPDIMDTTESMDTTVQRLVALDEGVFRHTMGYLLGRSGLYGNRYKTRRSKP